MRCRRCQRTISGIGKPAVPPVLPAVIALAGSIGGLWSLTLGQDPSNALPHWSPASGWGLGIGSVALASVLVWIGLVRRKCPDCGSTQMLDGMEEEAVSASEHLEAVRAALAEERDKLASRPHAASSPGPVPGNEDQLRASRDKEMADKLASREKELRSNLEQELRPRLARELAPQLEHDLRTRLEKELRKEIEQRLRAENSRSEAEHERLSRGKPEEVPTPPPGPPSTARPLRPSSTPQLVSGNRTPRSAEATATKDVTPPLAALFAPKVDGPAVSHASIKTTAPEPITLTKKTASRPAAPQAKVETAPLSTMSSPGKATTGAKGAAHPVSGKDSGGNGPGSAAG
jgi:predicted  nucleic acid-binding Zn-ribbon protein